jgi:hypothetical protein
MTVDRLIDTNGGRKVAWWSFEQLLRELVPQSIALSRIHFCNIKHPSRYTELPKFSHSGYMGTYFIETHTFIPRSWR